MTQLQTRVKKFRRFDVGSMNSRIYIYDRDIQAPHDTDVNFTQKFTSKLTCWAMMETVSGETIFDQSNIERVVTHTFGIRGIPQISRVETPVFNSVSITALNDMVVSGVFTYGSILNYVVEIDSIGANDTFRWSQDGGNTWAGQNVMLTGLLQSLSNGVSILFGNVTGHELGSYWTVLAVPAIRLTSQDWILYQNQFMGKQATYDILKVENLDQEGRFINLISTLTGDFERVANWA